MSKQKNGGTPPEFWRGMLHRAAPWEQPEWPEFPQERRAIAIEIERDFWKGAEEIGASSRLVNSRLKACDQVGGPVRFPLGGAVPA